ncbi:adenylate/guanylate cyclase domain-containing protein [Tsukamurella sp. 8F]|uniref:adenylate/guanylate cyclase domain-containing protein n=1 Tax=unclassified Tsukamurella TaxID=2633480 RepID=UPI0023B8D02A|nr:MULTISPECIES: adenylate/guanylate cyclase domain-containing protein [unclassified Tsukamurella]MDF0531493.1 adenylate/guanylate cyclase domain-containing protein [Tsukamurella sp. 8J]MDF0588737.1 adenylate/guanylate cyclase domain-containing protein [Tsukamurella sp. 8F]
MTDAENADDCTRGYPSSVDLQRVLLPGSREFTFRQMASLAGIEVEQLRVWWAAAGFPDLTDDDTPMFTEGDVALARDVAQLFFSPLIEDEAVVPGAQALGQALSRLAEWQATVVRSYLEQAQAMGDEEVASGLLQMVDRLAHMQSQMWRRHLAAAAERLVTPSQDGLTATMAVGFADMVGYTRLSRGLAITELNTLVTTFEATMHSVIRTGGGRIVKGVGDEVMFVADSPVEAAHIALRLQDPDITPDLGDLDVSLPQLRVGVAYGEVLTRFGDVFGNVVNLAARLTSGARPGSVLVDGVLAEALDGELDLRTKSLRPYRARGFTAIHPHLLRWATEKELEEEAEREVREREKELERIAREREKEAEQEEKERTKELKERAKALKAQQKAEAKAREDEPDEA